MKQKVIPEMNVINFQTWFWGGVLGSWLYWTQFLPPNYLTLFFLKRQTGKGTCVPVFDPLLRNVSGSVKLTTIIYRLLTDLVCLNQSQGPRTFVSKVRSLHDSLMDLSFSNTL